MLLWRVLCHSASQSFYVFIPVFEFFLLGYVLDLLFLPIILKFHNNVFLCRSFIYLFKWTFYDCLSLKIYIFRFCRKFWIVFLVYLPLLVLSQGSYYSLGGRPPRLIFFLSFIVIVDLCCLCIFYHFYIISRRNNDKYMYPIPRI